ncbi:MAG: polysaccharide deacetylase family protein [Bacillota bacterium]
MIVRTRVLVFLVFFLMLSLIAGLYIQRQKHQPVFECSQAPAKATDLPIFYVHTQEKKMALTFDISWGEKTPGLVLPILRERQQRATFFLSGPWSERHPQVVRRIVDDGHEIANHGHDHVNLSQYSKDQVAKNISQTHAILKRLSGTEPCFLRPPNGDYDDVVVLTARELNYETVIWSVDSLDWKNPGVDYMVKRVTGMAFPGAILLFHASDSSKQTHEALPRVLDALRADGYTLVTLGELMKAGEPARDDPRGRPKPTG